MASSPIDVEFKNREARFHNRLSLFLSLSLLFCWDEDQSDTGERTHAATVSFVLEFSTAVAVVCSAPRQMRQIDAFGWRFIPVSFGRLSHEARDSRSGENSSRFRPPWRWEIHGQSWHPLVSSFLTHSRYPPLRSSVLSHREPERSGRKRRCKKLKVSEAPNRPVDSVMCS